MLRLEKLFEKKYELVSQDDVEKEWNEMTNEEKS